MTTAPPRKPRVFVDADALFAGAAGPTEHGTSLMVLRMAEITLIDAVTSQQVIVEAERNLGDKLPAALSAFQVIVSRCLRVVSDSQPADLTAYAGLADPKDLPILVSAVRELPAARRRTPWLQAFPDPARRRGADAATWRQRQRPRAHLSQVLPAYEALLGDHDYR